MHCYLATGNRHKVTEVAAILQALGWPGTLHPAGELGGMPSVVEDGASFADNALLKARALRPMRAVMQHPAWLLADDSGLCVEALGGAPDLFSARFAGPRAADSDNNRKLLRLLEGLPAARRRARFVCTIACLGPDDSERTFTGYCVGHLLESPRGRNGFGYDPLFVPTGGLQTYAELRDLEKNCLSHRAAALRALVVSGVLGQGW